MATDEHLLQQISILYNSCDYLMFFPYFLVCVFVYLFVVVVFFYLPWPQNITVRRVEVIFFLFTVGFP